MEKSEKNMVPKYLFGAFCFYLLYFVSIILYLGTDRRWLIVPFVCLALSILVHMLYRDRVDIQAYAMTLFSFINIYAYSVMLHEFTEVFTVFCVTVCLISFYNFLKVNYLMAGLITGFIVYKLVLQGEWRYYLVRDGSIAITIRIFSLYLVQILLIMLIKRLQNTQVMVEQNTQAMVEQKARIETGPQLVFQPSSNHENRAVAGVRKRKKEDLHTTFTAPDVTILLVDDNKVNLKVAEGLLRPYRMHIDTADSGRLAIDMVQNKAYDLIFMDHMMPQMDGVEATGIIRSLDDERFRKIPIVALSANAVRGARELFLEAGMNDFVPKPIEMRVMDRVLCKWLPDDKMILNRNEEKAIDKEENKIVHGEMESLSWKMEGIDVAVGMQYSGDDENLYREVLSAYMDTIEEKASIIEKAVEEEDLETYTIEVHSLKSTSKSIGAMELSELAQGLEASGKNREWGAIIARTPMLLAMYRDLYQVILPYHTEAEQETGQKKSVNNDELMGLLDQLLDSMDTYDSIRGEEIVAELSKYNLTGSWDEYMKETADAMGRLDYDLCKEKASRWRSELEA